MNPAEQRSGKDRELILRSTLTSPYGRKVRMAADILGLTGQMRIIPANTLDETDALRQQNPLGKMPCLLLPDGSAIYDSRVIVEYLQELAGSDRLLPLRGAERFRTLTMTTLADGIADAALLMVYESRFRPPEHVSQKWLDHQRGKITRALSVFEQSPPDAAPSSLATIALACALGYLDWRKPMAWRADYPQLTQWLAHYIDQEPAFSRTQAVT
jgi:glutathione S-transferase